ncbi:MAG: DUF4835 family protein, partial [Bacteroidaceae bacterium]|nr:DUF4835 family protein [Bacteroidaceae bacterium]
MKHSTLLRLLLLFFVVAAPITAAAQELNAKVTVNTSKISNTKKEVFDALREKVQAFLKRNPHVDGVLSIGGWGADGFSDACLTEEGRKILADSLLTLMDDCGFVGIDVDWEYPGVPGTGIVSRE